jgi:uncharacterized protein (TIGR00106 family)
MSDWDGNFTGKHLVESQGLRRRLMAILEISIVPIGIEGSSLSPYVADCLRVLKEEKAHYELSAMGTNVEGNLKDLMRIAMKMHEVPFKKGAPRVLTTLKIDDRRDKKGTLSGKKKAVRSKLRKR